MMSSLGINLSPSSLALCSPDHYKHNQGYVSVASNAVPDFPDQMLCDNLSSGGNNLAVSGETSQDKNDSQACENDDILIKGENNNGLKKLKDKGSSEDAKTSVVVLCSDCGLVSCLCSGNADSDSLSIIVMIDDEESTNFEKNMENNFGTQCLMKNIKCLSLILSTEVILLGLNLSHLLPRHLSRLVVTSALCVECTWQVECSSTELI